MRLKYQLFLSFLLCGAILIALLAAVNSWSFERGFSKFVVESERRRLADVVEQLGQLYQEHNGWSWLESEPKQLEQVRQLSHPNRRRGEFAALEGRHSPDRGRRGANNIPDVRRRPPLILVDANHQLLVGNRIPRANMFWEPIPVDATPVGFIGIREPRGIPDGVDNLFLRQQFRRTVIAAVAMVILSGLLAIALASRLVKPILKINNAVGEISGGNYQHKIQSSSKNELGSLSANINLLAKNLDKNQNARQQWSAEISHELRTPVAILQGEIEAMQDGIKPINRDAIDSLHAETKRLSSLINDLHDLSLSDIGALDYRMAPVNIHDLVHQRLAAASTQIEQAALSVSLAPEQQSFTVNGDANRLGQLIDNLIQNSIRYTHSGGQVNVSLENVSNNNLSSIELNWNDSAPGVNDEQLTQLFNPLYRTDESRNRATGGAGLGLAIVKKIADAHGATVNAYHAKEGGLSVRLNFPV